MNTTRSGLYRPIPLFFLLLFLFGLQAPTFAAQDTHLTRAAGGFESARGSADRREPATLKDFSVEKKSTAIAANKQSTEATENLTCCAYRIYSAHTQLFDDLDRDGFFTYLRVSMDIDTDYYDAELYLQLYLRGGTGEWFQIFDSDVFTIYGSSGLDDYEVESELLSGFPADYYDVLIEVYDAYTGELVLEFGPADSPALSLLPMEDVILDSRSLPPIAYSSGGGGALSIPALTLLLCLALWHSSLVRRAWVNTRLSRRRRSFRPKD